MSAVDTIRPLLVWAAGGPGRPSLSGVPVDELVDALRLHRVERRFLLRSRVDGVALPDALTELLEERARDVDGRVREQLALFASVRDAVREQDPGSGLVPLKGFNLFGLTGDDSHAAYSGDIDVIGRDPHDVAAAVEQGSGYHFHGEEHPYVYAHMDAVEVHSRYLVTGFPAEAVPARPAAQGGVVELTEPFSVTSLTYEDLATHLVPGTGPAAGVEVLRPEIAVLVRCAHVYVGFAMNPQPEPVATVRLEELVQLRTYLELPSFDADVFRDLHKRFDAGLVTDFARRLHVHFFGWDPFDTVLGSEPAVRERFPQNLWWDGIDNGFPVELAWDPDELILASHDQDHLADQLGPWGVELDKDGTAVLDVVRDRVADASGRFMWHRFHGGVQGLRCVLRASEAGLGVTFRFDGVADDQMAAVGVAAGNQRYELFYRPREDSHDFSDYTRPRTIPRVVPAATPCTSQDGVVTVGVELPWTAVGLAGMPAAGQSFPLVLRARVQDRPWGAVTGGAVLPLRVQTR